MTEPTLTTESGAPVADNQNCATAGPDGPVLLQDQYLVEKLARFNRERIPERVVYARGSGAYGRFEVTHDVTRYTRAAFLSEVGKRTDAFIRFSVADRSAGSADAVRALRGFGIRFYTEAGNYNLVGSNSPVFFIRDPLKFPDLVHAQRPDPYTGIAEPENMFDFWSLTPEALHQITYLFGDRGIPAGYRHMNGYGGHAFQWVDEAGRAVWVKYHFHSRQSVKNLAQAEAEALAGRDPDAHQRDLYRAIERGDFPSWTLSVQVMPVEDADEYRFNPFDATKVWPHADYPLVPVGVLTLDRNPDNVFQEVEQAALAPGNFVPGIGPSPDRLLQGRLFAYPDAARYRLGVNHGKLPVNQPRDAAADYARDGLMRGDGNGGRSKNYQPNSAGGPVPTGRPLAAGYEVSGLIGAYPVTSHAEDDDFGQAGRLYRAMSPDERRRLAAHLAAPLAEVADRSIVDRFIGLLNRADAEYGESVEAAVKALRHED